MAKINKSNKTFFNTQVSPNQIPSPYGNKSLVSIIIDDGSPGIMTVGEGGCVGVTPAKYALDNGIPLTLAVSRKYIETGLYGSLDEDALVNLCLNYGCELANHSYNHTSFIESQSFVNTEIKDNKDFIETMDISSLLSGQTSVGTIVNNNLGVKCRGFLQPGTWTGEASGYINSIDKVDNFVAKTIKYHHEWSHAYVGNEIPHVYPIPRHFTVRFGLDSGMTVANIMDFLSTPNMRIAIIMHSATSDPYKLPYGSGYSFKELVDALVASESVVCVTGSTLFDAIPSSIMPDDNLVNYGNFDNWDFTVDTEPVTKSTYINGGWYVSVGSEHPNISTSVLMKTRDTGKAIQLTHGGSTGNWWNKYVRLDYRCCVMPSYTYKFTFDGMCTSSNESNKLSLQIMYYKGNNIYTNRRTINLSPIENTWTNDIPVIFTVPDWADHIRISFGDWNQGFSSASIPVNADKTVQIDNVRLMRV